MHVIQQHARTPASTDPADKVRAFYDCHAYLARILALGPANTTVPIWEQLVDSRTVELTANDNTPYTWFWVDFAAVRWPDARFASNTEVVAGCGNAARRRAIRLLRDAARQLQPGVDLVKKATTIYPLAQAADPPQINFVDMSGKPFNMVGPGDYTFWG